MVSAPECDVCGLPDPYAGTGDGIGSCDCPRCECGAAASSVLCICPPDDYWDDGASMADVIPEDWRGEAMA